MAAKKRSRADSETSRDTKRVKTIKVTPAAAPRKKGASSRKAKPTVTKQVEDIASVEAQPAATLALVTAPTTVATTVTATRAIAENEPTGIRLNDTITDTRTIVSLDYQEDDIDWDLGSQDGENVLVDGDSNDDTVVNSDSSRVQITQEDVPVQDHGKDDDFQIDLGSDAISETADSAKRHKEAETADADDVYETDKLLTKITKMEETDAKGYPPEKEGAEAPYKQEEENETKSVANAEQTSQYYREVLRFGVQCQFTTVRGLRSALGLNVLHDAVEVEFADTGVMIRASFEVIDTEAKVAERDETPATAQVQTEALTEALAGNDVVPSVEQQVPLAIDTKKAQNSLMSAPPLSTGAIPNHTLSRISCKFGNSCQRRDTCQYAHNGTALKQKLCTWVNTRTGCNKGGDCKMSHEKEGTQCVKSTWRSGCQLGCAFMHQDDMNTKWPSTAALGSAQLAQLAAHASRAASVASEGAAPPPAASMGPSNRHWKQHDQSFSRQRGRGRGNTRGGTGNGRGRWNPYPNGRDRGNSGGNGRGNRGGRRQPAGE
jgi:hypothetical protein